ncbi:hypothetical protein VTL71DRAFT_4403 [Oculimacula yallundae]|uniref:Heterokaryon incompatibility domain-containing protein n=1 Tax=Oculimacula yallundae TaxID=86028 RepID=A0ABR4C1X2_9HELO
MATTSATYRRLGQDELRLVSLLPGSSVSGIQCELVYTSFHTHPEYEAVSYTWGDPSITEDIILDGRPLTVTAGLARALHCFRQPKDKCLLWIDAICINQSDEEEKSHQVQLMFDIYRNSKAVRAWIGRGLGEESEDRARPLQGRLNSEFGDLGMQNVPNPLAVASVVQQDSWSVWNLIELLGQLADRSGIEYQSISESFMSSDGVNAWKDLCLLLLRPYWRRVWIQQEILDISKVIVYCGSMALSLSMLLDSCTAIDSYIDAAKETSPRIPRAGFFVRECFLQIQRIQFSSGLEDGGSQLHALLRSQMFKQTSDPRDKIYGIIGLVSSWRSTFPIDYRLSPCEVYISLFKFVVQKHNNLDALFSQIRVNAPRLAGLPSWCPDWSQTVLPSYVVGETDDMPNLFALPKFLPGHQIGPPPAFSFAGNDHILIVTGVVLDVCKSITACFSGAASFLSPSQRELLNDTLRLARRSVRGSDWPHWQNIESSHQNDNHEKGLTHLDKDEITSKTMLSVKEKLLFPHAKWSIKPQSLFQCDFEPDTHWFDQEEAILRMLVTNNKLCLNEDILAKFRTQMLSPGDGDDAENISNQLVPATYFSGASDSLSQRKDQTSGRIRLEDIVSSDIFDQPTRHRRFFVSSKNHTGLAPAEGQVNDMVCFIFGCPIPFMLRPVNGHFIFLGETYLHGWMNGEVMSLLESGQIQPQDFEIH